MSGGGSQFSIDIGLAGQVVTIFQNIDADVAQYANTLINLVSQLDSSWNSPNKAAFDSDWSIYCTSLQTIQSTGPNLVAGLNQEISLVTQAEQVSF
jgi:hypothetical protein